MFQLNNDYNVSGLIKLMVISQPSFEIKIGTEEDRDKIVQFSIALSEDAAVSQERWLKIIKLENIKSFLLYSENKIVGKVQTRIEKDTGWLESFKILPGYLMERVAQLLITEALAWFDENNVKISRTMIESDNLIIRTNLERLNFQISFLTINPSIKIDHTVISTNTSGNFAPLIGSKFYKIFYQYVGKYFNGFVFMDGRFIKLTNDLFNLIVHEKRVYTNSDKNIFIVLSRDRLPAEMMSYLIADDRDGYTQGAKAIIDFTSQEITSFAVCYAPAKRRAVKGLGGVGFSWKQPHSIIIYEKRISDK